jgi:molybdopterin converting factor small subunit
MGEVVIHLVGTLRLDFHGAAMKVDIKGSVPFRQLLNLVDADAGRDLSRVIYNPDTGEILPAITIFVNRVNLRQQQGLDTLVREGDEVMIMRADMAGG